MSTDDRFDFHLVAQKVTQGTSTPTHYVIAYDNSQIPQEDLIRFTYEQCYNYYNWQGSVKVPSCLQYANKLSKLAGESIQKPIVDSRLNESFYFLWSEIDRLMHLFWKFLHFAILIWNKKIEWATGYRKIWEFVCGANIYILILHNKIY